MNKANLKSYAPQARKDFIAAVTARANLLGISDKAGMLEVAPAHTQGDVTVIAGQAWPIKVDGQRQRLITRIRKDGFAHTMEAVAYTWFNRFAALRYMELHDYLGHGHRALSSTAGGLPDILTHATDLTNELPGLNAAKVTELKLAGNRDGELYRMLLVAQCNALSRAMPFLFERIDDDSELLLPDNLLRSDSVIAMLVEAIPEADWAEVEIIGWLYQFYISERKDQVIGKVVKSEDIPAATQLFTPNWIVQYLVQNSVGRLWLMANPQSTLAQEWPYYITPAEQTPEVQAQLDALIQTRVREDGDTLNPESITVLDPACGSGHILVVAYDVLKAIYLERGYQPRAIPRLILEKNLYGLDIDDRAAQMAGFALLMKARADDRRLFTATDEAGNLQPPKLNVLSLQESKGLSVDELATHLAPFKVQRATITALVDTFEHAKTFGSLIQIPYALQTNLTVLPQILALIKKSGDMYAAAAADDLLPLVEQAQMLAMQFDSVVANPPYMGKSGTNATLKTFLKGNYPAAKADTYAAFIQRGVSLARSEGFIGLVTLQGWMFIDTYTRLREYLFKRTSFVSIAHLGARAFEEISGEVVQTVAFVSLTSHIEAYSCKVKRLVDFDSEKKAENIKLEGNTFVLPASSELSVIPGGPIAYWLPRRWIEIYKTEPRVSSIGETAVGLQTGDNGTYLRYWHELQFDRIKLNAASRNEARASSAKWFAYNKGGKFRKWYGNQDLVVNWENDGLAIKSDKEKKLRTGQITENNSKCWNQERYFKPAISWTDLGSDRFGARFQPTGFVFDISSPSFFSEKPLLALGLLNSIVADQILNALNPTLHFNSGNVGNVAVPIDSLNINATLIDEHVSQLISTSKNDWDLNETSWEFRISPILSSLAQHLAGAHQAFSDECKLRIQAAIIREEECNRLFIDAYGLQDELSPEVPESQITLARANREKDSQRLISYAIGCMMGRYSLDEPGLIYAHAGNVGFEPDRYAIFPADADGIVPITDERWFADDACSRIHEFLRAVWGPDTLEENMAWLAESLGTKAAETADETIRRYIADKFFKDHLQTYKKRPIYWLFSSGKQGAFQALVYLHRYHEGTLARLRAEYVVPLTGKMQGRIESLQKDMDSASSTAARNKLSKELEKLKKKHTELLAYDEKLRHHADMRIQLDLDDGVKVNYGKFGDLLAEVKTVTGGAGDE